MNLAELKEAYKARKLALDSAKKEEEKYKALLKDAMLEAGESDYTDEAGYRFERIVQERKSMDEEKLLAELHERNLTSCTYCAHDDVYKDTGVEELRYRSPMDSLERCRILCGISEDNTKKLGLLTVLLEKAREDIEAFCRDTFIEALTNDEGIITGYTDVFPKQLKNVQEDLAIQRFRKLGAEGESSYTLADESVTFDDPLPVSVEKKLYPYRQLFPRSYTLDDPVGGYKEG